MGEVRAEMVGEKEGEWKKGFFSKAFLLYVEPTVRALLEALDVKDLQDKNNPNSFFWLSKSREMTSNRQS